MSVIWKFELPLDTVADVNMPAGATVLSVDLQGDTAVLWANCDPRQGAQARRFANVFTGHEVPNWAGRFIGTVNQRDARLVWHVFEATPGR